MKKILLIQMLLMVMYTTGYAQKTGLEIMKLVDNQINLADEYQEMKMSQINSKGKTMDRLLKMYIKRNMGLRKSLIVFTSPSDIKGSSFLSLENTDRDDDNWLYLPILRRSRRISSSDITDKFMGSDFTYEDLEEEDLNGFRYTYKGDDIVGEKNTYKVEAVPSSAQKVKESGYSKRVIYVDQKTNMVVKILYYNENGIHIKTFEAEDQRKLEGTNMNRSYLMRMTDLKKQHITEIDFKKIAINNNFEDALFSKRTLEGGI